MAGTKILQKGEYLFKEGDPPDSLYVVKSGRLVILKSKASSEIVLAKVHPGGMVGEMAFFDNRARSASAKADTKTELIELPFKALHAQFKRFPEWCRAIMKQVNIHLREANQRIKTLEKSAAEESEVFTPATTTKLTSILNLVGTKYGKVNDKKELVVPGWTVRNYTIQIFHEPTHKMQKLVETYAKLGHLKVQDIGEGRVQYIIPRPQFLFNFVEWYNDWIYADGEKKFEFDARDVKFSKAILHFCNPLERREDGKKVLNVTQVKNESMKELDFLVKPEEFDRFIELGLVGEKIMDKENNMIVELDDRELYRLAFFWEIVLSLREFVNEF